MGLTDWVGIWARNADVYHECLLATGWERPVIAENRRALGAGCGGGALEGIYYADGTIGPHKSVGLFHESTSGSALAVGATGPWVAPASRYLPAAPYSTRRVRP